MKNEDCQSIQQMHMFDHNQLDVDDPMDNIHGPVRLPFFKKGFKKLLFFVFGKNIPNCLIILDKILQIKTENSLEYPFQKNVYPSLSELAASESLMILQV